MASFHISSTTLPINDENTKSLIKAHVDRPQAVKQSSYMVESAEIDVLMCFAWYIPKRDSTQTELLNHSVTISWTRFPYTFPIIDPSTTALYDLLER